MAQRRANGLCYNYDEKFVLGHRCKKLFIIEIAGTGADDEEVDEEIECAALTVAHDAPAISLHAISLGDAVTVALLDSGSSHNFIDTAMAQRAGLQL